MTRQTLENRFFALLNEHRKILYKVAHTYTRDPDSRRDLEQDITVQLWKSFGRYDERLKFSTWMYRIALNVAISAYRSESRNRRHFVPADSSIIEIAQAADDSSATTANVTLLQEFIQKLDPLDRALIILYLDDESHATIAGILGISETNVGTKISRIKQRLRREFSQAR